MRNSRAPHLNLWCVETLPLKIHKWWRFRHGRMASPQTWSKDQRIIQRWTKDVNTIVKSPIYAKLVTRVTEISKWCRNPLLGPTWCVLGLSIELYTCRGLSWSWTPVCNLFLAFNSTLQPVFGVWLQNAAWNWRSMSSILNQSIDYYIFLESPGCLLSNAIESAPFGVL